MPLTFDATWRFRPPLNHEYVTKEIPDAPLRDFLELIRAVSTQGDRQEVLEHFKQHLCRVAGRTYVRSSNDSWAETDLWTEAHAAAENAPRFIDGFYDACRTLVGTLLAGPAPDEREINDVLARHNIGYHISAQNLTLRAHPEPLVQVSAPPPTLAEKAAEVLHGSLRRADELLGEGRWREAVQESLWLLETVSTAFRGLDTGAGTVEGKYFNKIVKELRTGRKGTSLDNVLQWATTLHGYLSSPSGGGVRHGLDLSVGVPVGNNEARLFCNLIRSYLSFLLEEHERLIQPK